MTAAVIGLMNATVRSLWKCPQFVELCKTKIIWRSIQCRPPDTGWSVTGRKCWLLFFWDPLLILLLIIFFIYNVKILIKSTFKVNHFFLMGSIEETLHEKTRHVWLRQMRNWMLVWWNLSVTFALIWVQLRYCMCLLDSISSKIYMMEYHLKKKKTIAQRSLWPKSNKKENYPLSLNRWYIKSVF